MKIAIGCDEAGYVIKEELKKMLAERGHEAVDFGCFDNEAVLYPDIGYAVASSVAKGNEERGILICGTGIGMAITANKVPGIRAAVCHDAYSASKARTSNDAQIMCLGARVLAKEYVEVLLDVWLKADFAGGNSAPKVERIQYYEKEIGSR